MNKNQEPLKDKIKETAEEVKEKTNQAAKIVGSHLAAIKTSTTLSNEEAELMENLKDKLNKKGFYPSKSEILPELPGIPKEKIDIELVNNQLRIHAEKEEEKETTNKKYHFSEISYGTFTRTYNLPRTVNSQSVKADYKEGLLTITDTLRSFIQTLDRASFTKTSLEFFEGIPKTTTVILKSLVSSDNEKLLAAQVYSKLLEKIGFFGKEIRDKKITPNQEELDACEKVANAIYNNNIELLRDSSEIANTLRINKI
nr:8845_t:CDS:2 [Entrophospora candida]